MGVVSQVCEEIEEIVHQYERNIDLKPADVRRLVRLADGAVGLLRNFQQKEDECQPAPESIAATSG